MKKDSTLYLAVFSFVVTFAFLVPLALANEFTKPAVAKNALFARRKAVLDAMGIPYAGKDEAIARYEELVSEIAGETPAFSAVVDGKETLAVQWTGAGLWGPIGIVLAADPEGSEIRGVAVVDQNETPGLGGRITEAWFLSQFRGERVGAGGIRARTGSETSGKADPDPDNSEIDGITGASRTSEGFANTVNGALGALRGIGGKK